MEDQGDKHEQDFLESMEAEREGLLALNDFDPMLQAEIAYRLWWRWADFELTVISPNLKAISPPVVIMPEKIHDTDEVEFVYPITDYGFKLATSKGEEMYSSGLSILTDRLSAEGVSAETEVLVAFGGHELLQRKGFESIINLTKNNVVVTNFDPGEWGEEYLRRVKRMVDLGYGYPAESPRIPYRQTYTSAMRKNK